MRRPAILARSYGSALAAQRLAELEGTIELRRQGRVEEAIDVIKTRLGKRTMDVFWCSQRRYTTLASLPSKGTA